MLDATIFKREDAGLAAGREAVPTRRHLHRPLHKEKQQQQHGSSGVVVREGPRNMALIGDSLSSSTEKHLQTLY